MDRRLIITIILTSCLAGLFFGNSAMAADSYYWFGTGGGAVPAPGTGGGGSGCYDAYESYKWREDCAGVSWAYYKADSEADSDTIFPFVAAPGALRATIPKQCSTNGGGFWHFGINAHGAYAENGIIGTGISKSYWGHWTTVSWGYLNNFTAPYDTSSGTPRQWVDVYQLEKYGTYEMVLHDYNEALQKAGYSTVSDLPANLYAFCYREGEDPEIQARSNVSADEVWDTTGDVVVEPTSGVVEQSVTVYTTVGQTVPIVFSHDFYADSRMNDVSWSVSKTFDVSLTGTEVAGTNPANLTELYNGNYYAVNRPGSDGDYKYIRRDSYTFTPSVESETGYRFCESLTVNGKVITRVCTRVIVTKEPPVEPVPTTCSTWTPSSYTNSTSENGTTSVVAKVRNLSLSTEWADVTYAKPTDRIRWIHCYYPGVQKVADTSATKRHGAHDGNLSSGGTTANTYDAMKNLYSFSNYFTISQERLIGKGFSIPTASYTIGDSSAQSYTDNYRVLAGQAGEKPLVEKITSSAPTYAWVRNEGRHSWACDYYSDTSCSKCGENSCPADAENCTPSCKSCVFSHSVCSHSNDYIASGTNGATTASDHADVYVPYNFVNTASVSIGSGVAYAGEQVTINNPSVRVGRRTNSTLRGSYATQVKDAKAELIVYVSSTSYGTAQTNISGTNFCDLVSVKNGMCGVADSASGLNWNTLGNLAGTTNEITSLGGDYNVFDASAGDYFCAAVAIYPYLSGNYDREGDLNTNPAGNKTWYLSAPSCVKIAKRPSLQVWGGGLYSAGDVTLFSSEKRVVNGVYGWTGYSSANTTVFGSWVELNIIANGKIGGLASGASTGEYGATVRSANGLGGSKEDYSVSICIRSPLTMPNGSCSKWINPGGVKGSMNKPKDKSSLIAKFTSGETPGVEFVNNTIAGLGETVIPAETTRVIYYDGTFSINGNIRYEDGYTSLLDIPKLIIYAKNINISCGVRQIDAVLIADGNVNTCPTYGTYNDSANSVRLKVNGAIIADTLTANRTYGAATGYNSGVPAEIVNYDTSLYLWGAPRASVTASGKLDTVYLKELAPRY